jgi:hypothetical protein
VRYDDHVRAVKLLRLLDHTIWDGKVEAILDFEKCDTLTVNELFSKLSLAEVDRGVTARLESPIDSHSLALVGGLGAKSNANTSSRMYSVPSLMSLLDEEFHVLREDELALLTKMFERLQENRVNTRKTTQTCFQCGKPEHFAVDYPEKVENKDSYKHRSKTDNKYRSRHDCKHKHKDERRSRKKDSRGRKARAMVGESELLWDSRSYQTQTMKCNKISRTKASTQNKRQPKVPFSTVDFSKVDPLYKCRSVSFYREASGLFIF